MQHVMSPTGVAVLLLLAIVVDYMSVGPDSLRDRIAFLMAVPAIREGFDGSPLDAWTVGWLSSIIDTLKGMADGAYIAGATTSVLVGAVIGVAAIYAVACLLPDRASKKLGRFAAMRFPTSAMYRINIKLWILAILIGLCADLPSGIVGDWLTWAVDGLVTLSATIPFTLFGVS
jgi:hypothetical protein